MSTSSSSFPDGVIPVQPPSRQRTISGIKPAGIKILIVATPKTGNTWLKHMLMLAYDLPMVDVPMSAVGPEFENLGDRWICHQHLFPCEPIVRILRKLGVHIITTVRHPADVLVSEFYYMKGWVNDGGPVGPSDPARLLLLDKEKPGANTLSYVRNGFANYLLYSIAWLPYGPIVVRYESMRADPLAELRRITRQIAPVDEENLENAVVFCELGMLRKRIPDSAYHFRKGGSQFSLKEDRLPAEIIQALSTESPYPEINARLGYAYDQVPELKKFDYRSVNPLHGHETFSNGVPITLGIIKLYFSLPKEMRLRWPTPAAVNGPDSFYSFLLEPIDDKAPVITRLARLVHQRRPDLVAAFPNFLTTGRWQYVNWFIYTGTIEYELHQALIEPIINSVLHIEPESAAIGEQSPVVASIKSLALSRADGTPATSLHVGDWVMVTAEITAAIAIAKPVVGLRLLSQDQREFFVCSTRATNPPMTPLAGGELRRVIFLLQLNVPHGDYHFAVDLIDEASGHAKIIDRQSSLGSFLLTGTRDWTGLAYCHAKVISND